MVFEQIEKLKREYTEKYVVVEAGRPELRRFHGVTGVVKTVNMNGRALVQFDLPDHPAWYDIDLRFLKIVAGPVEPPAAEKPKVAKAAKAATAAPASKPAPASAPAAKKPAPAAQGMSVQEILAAARGGAPAATAPAASAAADTSASATSKSAKKMSVEEVLAAARGASTDSSKAAAGSAAATNTHSEAAAPAAQKKREPQKMSTAEILAAARGQSADSAIGKEESDHQKVPAARVPAGVAHRTSQAADAPPQTGVQVAAQPSVAKEAVEQNPSSEPPARSPRPQTLPTSVADIVAYCRQRDGGI